MSAILVRITDNSECNTLMLLTYLRVQHPHPYPYTYEWTRWFCIFVYQGDQVTLHSKVLKGLGETELEKYQKGLVETALKKYEAFQSP